MDKKEDKKQKNKLSKAQLSTIIVAGISFLAALALIITNFFIPVKYLFSYMVLRNKGADEGVMRVRFVDVGYGDCTIVELPDGKNMLIDGGSGSGKNQSRIFRYLNKCDIGQIDYLVCTSVNNEHCGGLAEIIKYMPVKSIYLPYCTNTYITDGYRNFTLAANASGAELITGEYGVGEKNDEYGYFFKYLSPSIHSNPVGEYAELNSNPTSQQALDNASAVIWLEYAGAGIMLAGDARQDVLEGICNSYELLAGEYPVNFENCKVLKVPNHGNANSDCTRLYGLLKPELAVFSVGENGRGCPSQEALSATANILGENFYRTDEYGTVTIEVTTDGYKAVQE